MSEYPKTSNLYARDDETHKLIVGEFRDETLDCAQIGSWQVTEKIDGTNIRLVLPTELRPGGDYSVRGRSDAATLPKNFIEEAVPHIDLTLMLKALRAIDPDEYATGMIVYGEGYGPGIQKCGGQYAQKKSLRIFDVVTLADDREPLWRSWADVEAVSGVLGVPTAPVIRLDGSTRWPLDALVQYVQEGVYSRVAYEENAAGFTVVAEGIVARTDPYLYTSRGRRLKFKLKARDLC